MTRPKKDVATLSQARPKRAAALRNRTVVDAPTIAPDSAVGMPPKRQTRYTKTSKRAVLSPSPPPCELLTTSAPTQVPLPLPLKTPTPTPSDMDVGWLVGCDEYVLDDSTQYLLRPVQPHLPLNTIGQDSLCPAPHPLPSPHLANLSTLSVPAADRISMVMQLDLKPIPPHELVGLVSLGKPIAPHSPTPSASEDPGSEASVIIITDSDTVPDTTSTHTVPPEPDLTKPSALTPGMQLEVEEWLKTVGGSWVRHQEEKHGVPADVWLSHLHHLTRQHSKLTGGFNSWNSFQKWWKHHHQEECPLGSEEVCRMNTSTITSSYQKKMEELGTREARYNWCMSVEQELGCSTEEREDGVPPGLLRVRKLENDMMNVIVPAVLSKIYVFAGIIPANPRDPIARAASGLIVNDPLVSDILSAEGADLQLLFSNLELGVRNHLREQEGQLPLLKGDKVGLNTTLKKKVTASEVDQFDANTKPSAWCDMELEASEAMVALIKRAPNQSAGWKRTTNRLPEPWWQFAHLLFHCDPTLNKLPAERDAIIQRFRKHILLMTHDPVRKNGARALALIDDAIQGPGLTQSRHVRTEWRAWGKKLIDNGNIIGNWPSKAATKTIPIRSSKMGDSLADDFRAILIAILEQNEERRLYVGKQPAGADWLIKRLDGECVLRSEYQPEHSALPQLTPTPITLSPATSTKCTKHIRQKQKDLLAAVIPHPNTFVNHLPFDNIFHPDTTDDAFSVSAKGPHFSASEDIDYQLGANLLPLSMALPPPRSAHKRSAHVLGKHRAGELEPSPTKRFKRSEGLLHPDILSGASPMIGPSTMFGSLPPATQPMMTSTNAIPFHLDGQKTTLGRSAPPSTIPGPLPYPQYPHYGYGMPFPPVPPGMPGTSNAYSTSHSQMQPTVYHPMMGYYYPPGYGQQPPPPMS